MPTTRKPFSRRRWLLWTAGIAFAGLLALSIVLAVLARRIEPFLHDQIVAGLQQRFHTRVELDRFHVSVHHGKEARWGLWASGQGLRIWPPQRNSSGQPLQTAADAVPLIQLAEFDFHVPLRFRSARVIHIAEVQLSGLQIHIPPRTRLESVAPGQPAAPPGQNAAGALLSQVVVERILCDRATVVIDTDKPDKPPFQVEIARLALANPTPTGAMSFDALLTNPRPRGTITSTGEFGPLNTEDAGNTPIGGRYTFQNADLGDFKDIAGMLSSTGQFQGTVRSMAVDGVADVPDFRLTGFGTRVSLHTQFHARVDGTNGDTYLDSVSAVLGHSHFTTEGKIVRVGMSHDDAQDVSAANAKPPAGTPLAAPAPQSGPNHAVAPTGHLIDLTVNIPQGDIADFLRLVSRSGNPVLTGVLQSRSALTIPPGPLPVYKRIRIDGSFLLNQARLTDDKFQERVVDLSLRSQGKPGEVKKTDPNSITATMQGPFHMANGVIALPDLHYDVPGANIELKGSCNLDGPIAFEGTARMQATVSQMVGGWKGFLLKPADRFFKKQGAGTFVAIKVGGTREKPDFKIDFDRMKSTSPETPGQK